MRWFYFLSLFYSTIRRAWCRVYIVYIVCSEIRAWCLRRMDRFGFVGCVCTTYCVHALPGMKMMIHSMNHSRSLGIRAIPLRHIFGDHVIHVTYENAKFGNNSPHDAPSPLFPSPIFLSNETPFASFLSLPYSSNNPSNHKEPISPTATMGKVHGSLARAGKVKAATPKVRLSFFFFFFFFF